MVAGSLNHVAALAVGTSGIEPRRGSGVGRRRIQLDAAPPPLFRAVINGAFTPMRKASPPPSDDAIGKLIGAAEKVETFFIGLGKSIADFFEGVGHAIEQGWTFVIHKAEDAVRFICAIGDEVSISCLNTLEEVGSFFEWLWRQVKTGLEKLWEFLKLLFDWNDVLRVRDVMLDLIDQTLDCEFRRNPAGDSDLIPAGVPI